jgi:hypothetical protein
MMARKKKALREDVMEPGPVLSEPEVDVVPVAGLPENAPEETVEEAPAAKYKNTRNGMFVLGGLTWKPGESLEVPAGIADSKKFKHAVELGVLV